MPLILATAATFIVIIIAVGFLFSHLFQGSSSLDFASNDAYWANFMKKQLLCRELHILAALAAGLATGLVQCAWTNTSAVPLLLALGTVEVVWLLAMFVVLPPKEQTYSNLPRFALAVLAGAAVGIFACITLGVITTPLTVAGVLFLVAWILLTPL
ncbi:MAG: hypothetical protein Q8T09_03980 [Candidatus Melainabacteria bacterium]|nr:hypothetical protein [Candidatus Melainabacteria bacterium]